MGVSWEGRRAGFELEVVLCGMVRVRGKSCCSRAGPRKYHQRTGLEVRWR
jgi:hypothetical protein